MRSQTSSTDRLALGDKIKVAFYERLDQDEDKWPVTSGRARGVPREFHQHEELGGEISILDDGSVVVPILGRFDAIGETAKSLQDRMLASFEAMIGRKGFVNIVSIEHSPIYIIGAVKNPGAFKFAAGMTILHAVALAGGMKTKEIEPWQRIETDREIERLQRSLDNVKRLLTRTLVTRAERDNSPVPKNELQNLVGQNYTDSLVGDEEWQRSLIKTARVTEESSLIAAVNNARSEVAARTGRVAPLDESIKLRSERLANIRDLASRNTVSRALLIQTQAELSEVQDRRQQVMLDVEASKQRLAEAERQLQKLTVGSKVEIGRSIATAEQQTAEAVTSTSGILDVLKSLTASQIENPGNGSYEVVRRVDGETKTIQLVETATLRPGDLVRIGPSNLQSVSDNKALR